MLRLIIHLLVLFTRLRTLSTDLQECFEAEDLARERDDATTGPELARLDARIDELLAEGRALQVLLPRPRPNF